MNPKTPLKLMLLFTIAIIYYACQKQESAFSSHKPIPEKLARRIAEKVSIGFLQNQESKASKNYRTAVDIPNRTVDNIITVPDKNGIPALYICNYTNDSGFVVLSADLKHEPICAFIESGRFEQDTVPSMLIEWFEATIENIEMVREGLYDNTDRANYAWNDLLKQTGLRAIYESLGRPPIDTPPSPSCETGWTSTVKGPLLTTQWGQLCTYNELAPNKNCYNPCYNNKNAPTGCVATAMAQVIRYWQPPNQYNYNYASMPADYGNTEVQRMMLDAGKSVDMDWNCSGSEALDYKVDNALKNTFHFSSADGPSFFNHVNYGYGSHLTVRANLDRNWPVILGGYVKRTNRFLGLLYSYSSGHSWVCDGYWSSQNICYGYLRFHMNWGWNELSTDNNFNGWYAFNLWNPNTRNYQYGQSYIYNIHP